jgi:hypothetical protein
MLIQQVLLGLFALSVPAIGLVVALRLLWAACQAALASQIRLAAVSVLAGALLVALTVVVAAVWFGYGMAHSKKDGWSDLALVAFTGLPYYAVAYALWRMAARFQASLREPEVQPGAELTPEPRPGRVASNDARGSA